MKVKRKKWTEFWGKEWSKKSFQIIGAQDDQEHLQDILKCIHILLTIYTLTLKCYKLITIKLANKRWNIIGCNISNWHFKDRLVLGHFNFKLAFSSKT